MSLPGPDVLQKAGFTPDELRQRLEQLPSRIQEAIDRTAVQVNKLRAALDVLYTTGERKREANRTVDLINRLLGNQTDQQVQGDDTATAYPLRRFAEFGLLPGYEFPSEPATLRLLGDNEESNLIQSGRELGLGQYQPRAPVYARGRRWQPSSCRPAQAVCGGRPQTKGSGTVGQGPLGLREPAHPLRVRAKGRLVHSRTPDGGIIVSVLLSQYHSLDRKVSLMASNLPWKEPTHYEVFVVDRGHDLGLVQSGRCSAGGRVDLELRGLSVCLIKLRSLF